MARSALRSRSEPDDACAPDAAPDAGPRRDLGPVDHQRLGQPVEHPLGHQAQGVGVGGAGVLEQHGELVAAHAGGGVARSQAVGQPVGQLHQQAVAGGVAQAVVDHLEVVEVDEQHHRIGPAPAVDLQRVLHPVGQQHAVGEPGQRIVERLPDELALQRLALAHVADVQHQAGHVGIGQEVGGGDLHVEPVVVVVAQPAVDAGRRPGRPFGHVAQLGLDVGGLVPVEQGGEGLVQHLGGVVPEHGGDRWALELHHQLLVDDGDDVERVLHEGDEPVIGMAAVHRLGHGGPLPGQPELTGQRLEGVEQAGGGGRAHRGHQQTARAAGRRYRHAQDPRAQIVAVHRFRHRGRGLARVAGTEHGGGGRAGRCAALAGQQPDGGAPVVEQVAGGQHHRQLDGGVVGGHQQRGEPRLQRRLPTLVPHPGAQGPGQAGDEQRHHQQPAPPEGPVRAGVAHVDGEHQQHRHGAARPEDEHPGDGEPVGRAWGHADMRHRAVERGHGHQARSDEVAQHQRRIGRPEVVADAEPGHVGHDGHHRTEGHQPPGQRAQRQVGEQGMGQQADEGDVGDAVEQQPHLLAGQPVAQQRHPHALGQAGAERGHHHRRVHQGGHVVAGPGAQPAQALGEGDRTAETQHRGHLGRAAGGDECELGTDEQREHAEGPPRATGRGAAGDGTRQHGEGGEEQTGGPGGGP
ncbi:MAG: hypothetical protein R2755_14305 [Acidimicrobiales bacterium]